MSTMNPLRRGRHGLAVMLAVASLLLTVPSVLATDPASAPTDADVRLQAGAEPGSPTELRAQLEELTLRYEQLAAEHATLQRSVDDLSSERDELARSIERLKDIYAPLEADRQLLFELRKDLPETRPEAEAQLERIRALALTSDPGQLGQLADRLVEAAPAFFEWRFGDFASESEAAQAYVDSGAGAFDTSLTDFRNEVLMSVANRLDGVLTVLDRMR